MVRFRHHHFEADAYVLVADLLRTREESGMTPEVGDVLQKRCADVRHASSLDRAAPPRISQYRHIPAHQPRELVNLQDIIIGSVRKRSKLLRHDVRHA
jgi:hypothetical protein